MRTHVEPLPAARCRHCRGELRLKQVIESVDPVLELDQEIFVCAKCGREQRYMVSHNHYDPHLKTP